jgi:hypothetical protein
VEIIEQICRSADKVAGANLPPDWPSELHIAAFGGKCAAELIEQGEGETVLAWLASLNDGSFA